MNRTSADDIIIQALWPGPGTPGSVLVPSVLLIYASRLATRSSSDAVCPVTGAAATGPEGEGTIEAAGVALGWPAEAGAVAAAAGDGVTVGEAFVSSASAVFTLPDPNATIIPNRARKRIFLRQFSIRCIVS